MSGDRSDRPFDAGLQPERTALAWRRTALTLAVGAVVAIRILPEHLGAWALAPAGAGLALAIVIVIWAQRRYTAVHRRLTTSESDRIPLLDGRLAMTVTITVIGGGAASLATVVAIALAR